MGGEEVGYVLHTRLEFHAKFAVLAGREHARGDKRVYGAETPLQGPRIAPQLRRPAATYLAPDAALCVARLSVIPPQGVHRAGQPVLMQRVQSHAAELAKIHNSHQRWIVQVNNIEAAS